MKVVKLPPVWGQVYHTGQGQTSAPTPVLRGLDLAWLGATHTGSRERGRGLR